MRTFSVNIFESRLVKISIPLLLTLVFILHFRLVSESAVDVPYGDEWQMFDARAFASIHPFKWLLSFHNEHRILSTRLLAWTLYKLNNWDVSVHIRVNFLIYGLFLVLLGRIIVKDSASGYRWFAAASLVFLLSDLNWENHLTAFQSQFHFFMLFMVLAANLLFKREQKRVHLWGGVLSLVLAMCSFSAGIAGAWAITGIFVLYQAMCMKSSAGKSFQGQLVELAAAAATLGLASALWFAGYEKPSWHPALVYPWQKEFWVFLLNLVSLGFGFETFSVALGALCAAAVLLPAVLVFRQALRTLAHYDWRVLGLLSGIVFSLAAISMGRGANPDVQIWSKASRYWEVAAVLLPLALSSCLALVRSRRSVKAELLLPGFFFLAVLGYSNNWSFRVYPWIAEQRLKGIACAEEYYFRNGLPHCPELWGNEISGKLRQAKKAQLSFYRRLRARHPS